MGYTRQLLWDGFGQVRRVTVPMRQNCSGTVGYAVVVSMLIAVCLGFLQVALTFTPENVSWFLQLGILFGLMCAPLGAVSGAISGLCALFALRVLDAQATALTRTFAAGASLALGCAPGVGLAIWVYTHFALEIDSPSPLFIFELAAAVCIISGGGAIGVRSRLRSEP